MNDSYISYGSDGSYHIISPIGEGFDIETAFLIALVIIAICYKKDCETSCDKVCKKHEF